ncbi:MAG: Diguanylate cyclase protein [Frankiales bacterium]|nr:Diguanylate cyclase protein [Frankiales bacterium]
MLGRPLPRAVGEPVAYGVQALTALATCGLLVRRRGVRSDGRLRRARLLLAGALVCGALAGVLALVVHVVTGQPPAVPSLPDAVHFGFLPLAVLGLLAYPTVDDEMGSALRSLLDGLVAALSLWFVAYVLLLEPAAVGQDLSQAAALTALAYPTADVFVLGVLAGALPRVAASSRRELVLIGSGFAAYLRRGRSCSGRWSTAART